MSRLTLKQILLGNLRQTISPNNRMNYMAREKAYEALKNYTGQDFGYDADAWQEWFKNTKDPWKGLRELQASEQDNT